MVYTNSGKYLFWCSLSEIYASILTTENHRYYWKYQNLRFCAKCCSKFVQQKSSHHIFTMGKETYKQFAEKDKNLQNGVECVPPPFPSAKKKQINN